MEQLLLGDDSSFIAFKVAWDKALKLLAEGISGPSFDAFVRTAKPVSYDGRKAVIGAQNELATIFLGKYADAIKVAIEASLGRPVSLSFAIAATPEAAPRTPESKTREPRSRGGVVTEVSLPLNAKFTFRSFIVGPSNRLAQAVARAVADKPGEAYNPFFLYGGPGLGKTHLLQAIGNHLLEKHPGLRVAYVSGEKFTSHYVASLREHRSEDFRRKYRSIDVWLMDDVQFLIGKERTKEEFFHTFNALRDENRQIVLSSDRAPAELSPVEERLSSRFQSGMTTDIAAPDLETRMAILESKAHAEDLLISQEILECVAETIQTNVRALEGALVTLAAHVSLMGIELTREAALDILGRYIPSCRILEISAEAVQRAVSSAMQVSVQDLVGQCRQKEMALARHVAMYLCRELTDSTLPLIGRAFGGRSHATVIHACDKVHEMIASDPDTASLVERIAGDLRSGSY